MKQVEAKPHMDLYIKHQADQEIRPFITYATQNVTLTAPCLCRRFSIYLFLRDRTWKIILQFLKDLYQS